MSVNKIKVALRCLKAWMKPAALLVEENLNDARQHHCPLVLRRCITEQL